MTRTAGAPIGCQRPSRFWGLGCPKIYHEVEDTLVHVSLVHGHLPLLHGHAGGVCQSRHGKGGKECGCGNHVAQFHWIVSGAALQQRVLWYRCRSMAPQRRDDIT
ncbi:hypothetical protein [Thiolapillus sp.]|uniref:hypothetical protein n=1 Tax=Thiolapillus sp. TaxID=2017437 RepID=UPI0025E44F7B|nr:hypothetical protein [Thiolapillus sp.]